jgi:hypothetical protein
MLSPTGSPLLLNSKAEMIGASPNDSGSNGSIFSPVAPGSRVSVAVGNDGIVGVELGYT